MAEKKIPFDRHNSGSTGSEQPRKRRTKRKKVRDAILILLAVAVIGFTTVAAVVISFINDAPPLDPQRLETVETSYLFDSKGLEITALHDEQNRVTVTLDEIPQHVIDAFIAIEDVRFYNHFGFDITGSFRAAFANFRAGTIVQGASTITQQLARNAFLTTETSYKRKIQEIWLAIQLERNYSKEEILELYLNRIYFGNGAYGVEAAALTYFGKNIGELTIAEAAMIAGAVRWPNYYNPIDNVVEAEGRMRLVLANMLRLSLISEEEYQAAISSTMHYIRRQSQDDYPYPHYVDYVVHHELIRILSALPSIGSREEAYRAIYTGGLQIYTNLIPDMQQHVEDVLGRTDLYPTTIMLNMPRVREAVAELSAKHDLTRAQLAELVDEEGGVAQPQAAIVLADPVTGKIIALGGGRDYEKRVNEVLRFVTLRQPGSAIKPIVTYGPAFEEGILAGAGSTLDDSPYINTKGNWFPENFDYKFRGMITAREALYFSYNIPAIRLLEALGPRIGADYAERMGITTLHPSEVDNLSLTLGGLTYGVSAIDMAQAYSVLANNGVKIDLHSVDRIINRHGDVIYQSRPDPKQILSPQAAFLVNDILQDFVNRYLGRALQIDRPIAAKTGTTENWKDVYLVAYTPNIVASFWMGYDEPKTGSIKQGWRYSTQFLREILVEIFKDLEIKPFERPEGITSVSVCNKSGLPPNDYCGAAGTVISDYFIENLIPGETCTMHTGMFYNRPPYIITDERWSREGGPGRGPDDALGMPAGGVFDMLEQSGSTTREISLFNAYTIPDGVTLQWQYNGPPVSGFILIRYGRGDSDSETVELDANARQHTDTGLAENASYTYNLSAVFQGGELSDPATVSVDTGVASSGPEGGFFGFPGQTTSEMVTVPNVVGEFQPIAESKLSQAGLRVGNIEAKIDEGQPRLSVLSQEPAAGSVVRRGTPVYLVISDYKMFLDN